MLSVQEFVVFSVFQEFVSVVVSQEFVSIVFQEFTSLLVFVLFVLSFLSKQEVNPKTLTNIKTAIIFFIKFY